MAEYMPEFKTEDEFETNFKREIELCDKHRDPATGMMTFDSTQEFVDFLHELLDDECIVWTSERLMGIREA